MAFHCARSYSYGFPLHYSSVVEMHGGCPIPILHGPSETGKTTAILAGLSMFGSCNMAHYVKGTNSFFIDRSSMTTLPFGIDDPNINASGVKSKANFLNMAELVINFYNGARTANCLKGSKKPLSLPLVATNFMFKHDARYTNMLIVTSELQL